MKTDEGYEARIDRLTQTLIYVAGELWALRDRQAVLEKLLVEGGICAPSLIDNYRPDAELTQKLEAEREAFIARILSYLAPES